MRELCPTPTLGGLNLLKIAFIKLALIAKNLKSGCSYL